MDWKEKVTGLSENVFAGISYNVDIDIYGREVNSNLPLQIAAYLNVVFAPIWAVIMMILLYNNYEEFSEIYKFLVVTVILIAFTLEPLRLYMCYEGNLKDKIPELAGFWMLSTFIQFPLQAFLLFDSRLQIYYIQVAAQGVMFLLLSIELICGYCALKYTANQQANYYRIVKLRNEIDGSDSAIKKSK
ncbi:transmembrane protein 17-like isoform X3 [Cylas formicarius]|uniref:transmembrane protein 17-like isoform X3 n=1 Tax=Cylas formicarius TaxID=197179 RepID=UPI00295852BB|nr:transmembrane protein 17-like isoform X3 [Cylas formicarius]